ncbi:unnamed protein product [Pylaiella littoralis]
MASTDRDALVALYNATDGANWRLKANWNTDVDISLWHGIALNDQGRVVQLHLSGNNLRGILRFSRSRRVVFLRLGLDVDFLADIHPLSRIAAMPAEKLRCWELPCSIPKELGALGKLQRLVLVVNKLTGSIPKELGGLSELQGLYLFSNQLTGPIPKELGDLTELKLLDVRCNELSGKRRLQLSSLEISFCSPRNSYDIRLFAICTGTIPEELGKLTALRVLYLERNNLSGEKTEKVVSLLRAPSSAEIAPALSSRFLPSNLYFNIFNDHARACVHAGLWDTLGQKEAGLMAARPGTLPVALASLLDIFDKIGGLGGLILSLNPWEHPPEAIVAGGMREVRRYFEAIFTGGTTSVTRPLKVVIVGQETVGKTSLRRSIKAGKPCMTGEGSVDSTVHVDVEDHKLGGHPIRMFDCAGQVVYYGLLQLFLTPRAVYLLVWDAAKASKMDDLDLEDLAIAPWLRYLTFRVPDANVILVGNKWDRVVKAKQEVSVEVEDQSRQWLSSWTEKAHGHQTQRLSLEDGVSLVSCAPSVLGVLAPSFGMGTGWPCDRSCDKRTPGLFHRILCNPVDDKRAVTMDDSRAVTMHLPPSYQLALEMLEKLASSSRREAEQQTAWITRASLEEKWQAKVDELERAKTPVEAPGAAMSGAILIKSWEGGLVEYGSFIFLDVQWFATVLDPLFSHKRDSFGNLDLGGRRVKNALSLNRLEKENILEPQLAEDLWGAELAPHLLLALKSAGLTFPFPKDSKGGLVILLRMDAKPPDEYSMKLNSQLGQADQAGKHGLCLHVECSFSLGLPPGFIERLLARCCHLGLPYPFWRYGALIVGEDGEEGLFSLSLEYSEKNNILTVKVYGGYMEVHAWGALSKVLSVTIKMLAEFPGLPCESTLFCPLHKDMGMPIRTTDAQPGTPLVESSFCPLCKEQKAGKGLLTVALQTVKFSDEEFFDAQLCQGFAKNAENVALWPGNSEVRDLWPQANGTMYIQCTHRDSAPRTATAESEPPGKTGQSSHAPLQPSPSHQDAQTPWYQDVKAWVGAASLACLAVVGVSLAKEDDDPRLWGVFLGVGLLLLGLELALIAREFKILCFTSG